MVLQLHVVAQNVLAYVVDARLVVDHLHELAVGVVAAQTCATRFQRAQTPLHLFQLALGLGAEDGRVLREVGGRGRLQREAVQLLSARFCPDLGLEVAHAEFRVLEPLGALLGGPREAPLQLCEVGGERVQLGAAAGAGVVVADLGEDLLEQVFVAREDLRGLLVVGVALGLEVGELAVGALPGGGVGAGF